MKRKLFFRATLSFSKQIRNYSVFFKLILLPLFCISSFFNATALKNDSLVQNNKAIIYVGEDALIYGDSHIFNGKIIKILEEPNETKSVQSKKKNTTLHAQMVSNKENKNKELKKLQQKINEQVSKFYSASNDNDLIRLVTAKFADVATISTPYSFFKDIKATISIDDALHFLRIRNVKQKFYTSLSYTEFGKLRDSFLRGPPHFI